MNKKNLGLPSVISTGVGLIVATSCLLSIGQGSSFVGTPFIITMAIACLFNILSAFSVCELNAIMPNLTGGLAQYTLACLGPFVSIIAMVGGYMISLTISGSIECAMFGNTITSILPDVGIPSSVYCIVLLVLLIIVNLHGIDLFAKIQNVVAYGLIISLVIMGIMGTFKLGINTPVSQPTVVSSDFKDVTSLLGLAFFLFIGCEFIIPISNKVKNARFNVPVGMVASLLIVMIMQVFLVIGFSNYTPWSNLGESAVPHILYGQNLLGNIGTIWMVVVSILAVISSVNTIISSLSYICAGMAKIRLLPPVFMKTNKKGAPYVGVLMIGGSMILINATGLSSTNQLAFLILTGCIFWIIAYIVLHCNVLVLRKRLPKVPRTFKIPGGFLIPVLGIIGNVWMILNIDSDPQNRLKIYMICGIVFGILSIYSVIWIKKVMKTDLFKPVPVKEIMAMEHELYQTYHTDLNVIAE